MYGHIKEGMTEGDQGRWERMFKLGEGQQGRTLGELSSIIYRAPGGGGARGGGREEGSRR